jgi:hypothetical protein
MQQHRPLHENVGDVEALLSAESSDNIIVLDLKDLWIRTLSVFLGVARRVGSSSRIAQHTSVSGSMENGSELVNKKTRRLRWNLPRCLIEMIEALPHVDLSRS